MSRHLLMNSYDIAGGTHIRTNTNINANHDITANYNLIGQPFEITQTSTFYRGDISTNHLHQNTKINERLTEKPSSSYTNISNSRES